MTAKNSSYLPIADYGAIGNLHTTALISKTGRIGFMCFPRFDSPSVFTRLLDDDKGGSFSITPQSVFQTKQLYLPETNILVTRFLGEHGIDELTDFMPITDEDAGFALYRKIKCVSGEQTYLIECDLVFDYARQPAAAQSVDGGYLLSGDGGEQPDLVLETDCEMKIADNKLSCEFTLKAGEEAIFLLRHADGILRQENANEEFIKCRKFWHGWIGQTDYNGPWKESVLRSALALKLLTSARYGSTIAAATYGLPEEIGGERNWDYRYTWIRDSAFTMYAFLRLGFRSEAEHFMEWIEKVACEELQLLYGFDGREKLPESELDHLSGYENSQPVRIGNAAYSQKQMDIYGELIDTIYLFHRSGGSVTYSLWEMIAKLVEYVIDHWKDKDHGIWEVRSGKQRFLHSALCCWVAIDRAMKIGDDRSLPFEKGRWRETRDEIYRDVYNNFWSEEKQAYVQYKGADVVDASALLLPLLRFYSSKEPRWLSTLSAIEKELVVDVLVFRYRSENGQSTDGLEGEESTFTICSFWYVECLARCGRLDEAKLAFEKLMGYANHLGLFSEEISLKGEQLGNFPQAFSHLALISAAFQIGKKEEVHKG